MSQSAIVKNGRTSPRRAAKVFFCAVHAFFAGFCEGMEANCAILDGVFAFFSGGCQRFDT